MVDNEENRTAAAKEYMKIAPPKDLLQDFTSGVAEKLPEQFRKPFMTVISSQELQDAANQIVLKALVKHFTANEIKAMIAFYSTPEGKAILQKDGAYRAEVMNGINIELMTAFKKAVQEQHPKTPEGQQPPAAGQLPPGHPAPTGPKPAPPSPKPAPPAAK